MLKNRKPNNGFSLIEALVALGIFVVSIVATATLFLSATIIGDRTIKETQAVFLAREGLEAVRSMPADELVNGSHGLTLGTRWSLTVTTPEVIDGFERIITISDGGKAGAKRITAEVDHPEKELGVVLTDCLVSN